MKLFNSRRRKVLATVAACAIAGITTLAIAQWLTDGTGSGSTQAAQLQALTVQPSDTSPAPSDRCLPGGTCPLHFRVGNPNPALTIVSAMPAGQVQGTAQCSGTNWDLNPAVQDGLAIPLPPGTSEVVIPGAARLNADAPNGCQGFQAQIPARIVASD